MNQGKGASDSRSETKAKKYRLCKLIALSVLVAFILSGLVLFENDITMENLRYLVKYLDFSAGGAFTDGTVIHYNADSENRFYVFRGDLAIINGSGVSLYDRRGTIVMSDSFSMSSPVAVCSDKYLAVYDLGGNVLRLYNSFSLLLEKSFDYPVQSVSLNSDGAFCVVTAARSYHSAVYVYDEDFREARNWFSADKFATDACLSDDDRLLITAVKVVNGGLQSELIELKLGKKDEQTLFVLNDQLPIAHDSIENGTLLLSDESLKYIVSGEEKGSAAFLEDSLKMVAFGEERCAVLQDDLSVGVSFSLRIFDRAANELYQFPFSVQVRDIEVYRDIVYVLTHQSLFVISETGVLQEHLLDGDYSEFGVLSSNCVVLCSDSSAVIRIFDK